MCGYKGNHGDIAYRERALIQITFYYTTWAPYLAPPSKYILHFYLLVRPASDVLHGDMTSHAVKSVRERPPNCVCVSRSKLYNAMYAKKYTVCVCWTERPLRALTHKTSVRVEMIQALLGLLLCLHLCLLRSAQLWIKIKSQFIETYIVLNRWENFEQIFLISTAVQMRILKALICVLSKINYSSFFLDRSPSLNIINKFIEIWN